MLGKRPPLEPLIGDQRVSKARSVVFQESVRRQLVKDSGNAGSGAPPTRFGWPLQIAELAAGDDVVVRVAGAAGLTTVTVTRGAVLVTVCILPASVTVTGGAWTTEMDCFATRLVDTTVVVDTVVTVAVGASASGEPPVDPVEQADAMTRPTRAEAANVRALKFTAQTS